MTGIDRNALYQDEPLIRDVGTSRWIAIAGTARGVITIGGTGSYILTFAVRTMLDTQSGLFDQAVMADGEGGIVQMTINGGESKALPWPIFLFHAFRVNFEPIAETGNPVGIVLSA